MKPKPFAFPSLVTTETVFTEDFVDSSKDFFKRFSSILKRRKRILTKNSDRQNSALLWSLNFERWFAEFSLESFRFFCFSSWSSHFSSMFYRWFSWDLRNFLLPSSWTERKNNPSNISTNEPKEKSRWKAFFYARLFKAQKFARKQQRPWKHLILSEIVVRSIVRF